MKQIALFTTGGTIDGADSDKGTCRQTSDAGRWLSAQKNIHYTEKALFNKDSREITSDDRMTIVRAIQSCSTDLILLTHGTYTIAETGSVLKQAIGDPNKLVLLVGAWVPFSEANSDAPTQMMFALEKLSSGLHGVYIAMDNRLWDPSRTIKREISKGCYQLEEKSV